MLLAKQMRAQDSGGPSGKETGPLGWGDGTMVKETATSTKTELGSQEAM